MELRRPCPDSRCVIRLTDPLRSFWFEWKDGLNNLVFFERRLEILILTDGTRFDGRPTQKQRELSLPFFLNIYFALGFRFRGFGGCMVASTETAQDAAHPHAEVVDETVGRRDD